MVRGHTLSCQVRDSGLDSPEPVLVLGHCLHPHADALVLAADLVDKSPCLGLFGRLGDEVLMAQPLLKLAQKLLASTDLDRQVAVFALPVL